MSTIRYKNDYLIESFESSPERWRARVRRGDAQKIRTATGEEFESITTGGMESLNEKDAITVAQKMIDQGGL
jgi:hypothetical protein